jgi:predicted nucleic acid-binding protein
MAMVVFDSSALVKLLVEEDGSDVAADVWDAADAVICSQLAYPEVCAALAAAERARRMSPRQRSIALDAWRRLWAGVRTVDLTSDIALAAGALADEYGLRGADAVHLATVAAVGEHRTLFAAWDARLRDGAAALGIAVVP